MKPLTILMGAIMTAIVRRFLREMPRCFDINAEVGPALTGFAAEAREGRGLNHAEPSKPHYPPLGEE
jgi:hypothetical protein